MLFLTARLHKSDERKTIADWHFQFLTFDHVSFGKILFCLEDLVETSRAFALFWHQFQAQRRSILPKLLA